MELNHLLDKVEPSKSVTLLARTKELQRTDPTIVNMTGGEPDFPTPEKICQAVYKELEAGNTHYSDSKGNADLRARIARKLAEENHAPYAMENILVTPGAKYAVYVGIQSMINPGDEAIWLTPGWVSYPAMINLCGGTPVAVHLRYEDDYRITCDLLEAATTEKTKLLILNYPNNPTGKILSREEMEELKIYLRRHPQVYVLSDEIYEKIVYDGRVCESLAGDSEFFERVMVVNGFSKCSAMTGWRIGYLACSPKIYPAAHKIFQHSMSCTSGFLQKGALVALDLPEETERMRAEYEKRMNILVEGINKIPGLELKRPEGAFYAWIRFDTRLSSEKMCNKLLEEKKLAGVPGSAYGEENGCLIRFSFATSEEVIREMIKRLSEV